MSVCLPLCVSVVDKFLLRNSVSVKCVCDSVGQVLAEELGKHLSVYLFCLSACLCVSCRQVLAEELGKCLSVYLFV